MTVLAGPKRIVPWLNGLLAYWAWKAVGLIVSRNPPPTPVAGPVCVVQVNALGDVLMVTPLLRSLVDRLGPGRVDVVVREASAPLLAGFPGLGEIITLRSHLRWREASSVLAFFRLAWLLRRRRYQAVLDASRLMQSAWLTYLSQAGKRVGFRLTRRLGPFTVERLGYLYTDEIGADAGSHMVKQNLSLLEPLNLAPGSARIEFSPTECDRRAATAWLEAHGVSPGHAYTVIHPGAKWPPKRWHAERFRALAARIMATGHTVILIGDGKEMYVLQEVAGSMSPPPLVLSGELSLRAVAALIQRARVFIGNDSAPMHIADAVGTPVIALFGPTSPGRTGPLLSSKGAIMKPIECRPCRMYYTRDRCERGHNYCMDLIEVDDVWAHAEPLIGRPECSGSHDGQTG